jgi:hypothetical protein
VVTAGIESVKEALAQYSANRTQSGATVCAVRGEFLHVEADGTCNEWTLFSTQTNPK